MKSIRITALAAALLMTGTLHSVNKSSIDKDRNGTATTAEVIAVGWDSS